MSADHRFFEDETFEFLTLSALGSASVRLAEVGEVLATVDAIEDGDLQSWFDAWMTTGERLEAVAREAESNGHRQTARDAFLRASMYIGNAFFNVLGTDRAGDKVAIWKRHRECAAAAFRLWETPVEKVAIPYEGTTLEGFFFAGADVSGDTRGADGRGPLIVFNNGSDGTVVEMLALGVDEAVRRGYHALVFDGPGQGQALYVQGLPFRHDWEKVLGPVLDWALVRDDVDPDRVATFGWSQAGYWVPRAAAFEHRLAAIAVDPGVVDVSASWLSHFPQPMIDLLQAHDRETFEAWMAQAPSDPATEAMGAKRMEPFLSDSFYDVLVELQQWNLTDVVGQIKCPVLITDPEGEGFWPGQSQQLYDLLRCPKTLMPFTAAEGADLHCEPKAPIVRSHRVLDWFDQTLG